MLNPDQEKLLIALVGPMDEVALNGDGTNSVAGHMMLQENYSWAHMVLNYIDQGFTPTPPERPQREYYRQMVDLVEEMDPSREQTSTQIHLMKQESYPIRSMGVALGGNHGKSYGHADNHDR